MICETCISKDRIKNYVKGQGVGKLEAGYRREIHCDVCNNLHVIIEGFSPLCKKATEVLFRTYIKEWRWYCESLTTDIPNGWHNYLKSISIQISEEIEEENKCLVINDPDWIFRSEGVWGNLIIPIELAEKIAVLDEMPPLN